MGMVKQAILGASMLSCSQKQLNLGCLFECVKGICLRATPPIIIWPCSNVYEIQHCVKLFSNPD
jgi:hypothetical protein